jgi:3D (Asp-Asp-Asp) domain-containing protein
MTVLELMERTGMREETLAIAYIKDAIHLIQSNTKEKVEVNKQDIIKSIAADDNVYQTPSDLIAINNVSILDTSDDKYKKIKRITSQPHYLLEDKAP